jgi:hypothetical protein
MLSSPTSRSIFDEDENSSTGSRSSFSEDQQNDPFESNVVSPGKGGRYTAADNFS